MNIPEQAVEAAARSIHDVHCGCGEKDRYEYSAINAVQAEAALEAALPHIETALRKQIAAEIQRRKRDMAGGYADTAKAMLEVGMEEAARIAEGTNQ